MQYFSPTRWIGDSNPLMREWGPSFGSGNRVYAAFEKDWSHHKSDKQRLYELRKHATSGVTLRPEAKKVEAKAEDKKPVKRKHKSGVTARPGYAEAAFGKQIGRAPGGRCKCGRMRKNCKTGCP